MELRNDLSIISDMHLMQAGTLAKTGRKDVKCFLPGKLPLNILNEFLELYTSANNNVATPSIEEEIRKGGRTGELRRFQGDEIESVHKLQTFNLVMPEVFNRASRIYLENWIPAQPTANSRCFRHGNDSLMFEFMDRH
ncbi:MAG: hypothetical protein HZB61_12090 [Nitrospirae bacterium]|nr:hypothetical protein [Nitrospirota bacterium]